jgi:hypothetical protein
LADGTTSIDSGETLVELDSRRDTDRLQTDGNTVHALIDATSANIPLGKALRVVYHPPGAKALVGKGKGAAAASSAKVEVLRRKKDSASHAKVQEVAH